MVRHLTNGNYDYSISWSINTKDCKENKIVTDAIKKKLAIYGVLVAMIEYSALESPFSVFHIVFV